MINTSHGKSVGKYHMVIRVKNQVELHNVLFVLWAYIKNYAESAKAFIE